MTHNTMTFPSGIYHYRYDCPINVSHFTANDYVCGNCICYVCKVSLAFSCRTRSHVFAAPWHECNWDASRMALSVPHQGNVAKSRLIITLKVPIRLTEIEVYHDFGVSLAVLQEYLSDFCGPHIWRWLGQSDLFSREVRQHINFESIAALCGNVRANPASVAYMQRFVPDTCTDRQFQVLFKLHGMDRLDAYVYTVAPDRILFFRHCKAMMRVMEKSMNMARISLASYELPCSRLLFSHQRLSLSRMLHVEAKGMTDFLFSRAVTDDKKSIYICSDLQLLFESDKFVPDASQYGGLLTNDRGTGKTFITACLIQASKAPDAWLNANDVVYEAVSDDEEPDVLVAAPKLPRVCATLVVVPKPMLIDQWLHELKMLPLRTHVFYGKTRESEIDWSTVDVLITTADVLRNSIAKDDSLFRRVHFWRLVMDECHKLFQGVSLNKTGRALELVRARNRWGITATPELGTVARCRQYLVLLFGTPSQQSIQTSLLHHYVLVPRRYDDSSAAYIKRAICVADTVHGGVLPPVHFHHHVVHAPDAWLAQYSHVYDVCLELIENFHSMQKLVLLHRLLSAVAGSAPMALPSADMFAEPADPSAPVVPPDVVDCSICLGELCVPVMSTCQHYFCQACLLKWCSNGHNNCPLCRTVMGEHVRCQEFGKPDSSTDAALAENIDKLQHILDIINRLVQDSPDNRILVFSRFPKVRQRLHAMLEHVPHTQFVAAFQEQDEQRVLILSPQSCGVGLNLMQANHVILAEPSFRKSVEEQAYGRAVRIGQTRDVHVHHIAIAETLEARLLLRAHTDIHELFCK
jgi:hypothetical protein